MPAEPHAIAHQESEQDPTSLDRRHFLQLAGAVPFALLAACGSSEDPAPAEPKARPAPKPPPPAAPRPAEPPPPAAAQPPGDPDTLLVTQIDAMAPTVEALGYVAESTTPGQNCANCLFYTAEGEGRGRCTLFGQGLVVSGGWCTSWAEQQPA